MFKKTKLFSFEWMNFKKIRQNRKYQGILDKIINTSIFLIFFLTPLFFLGITRQGVGFEKTLLFGGLVLIGTGACLIKSIIQKKWVWQRTFLDWPLLFLLTIYLLATIFSVGLKDSLLGSYGNISQGFLTVFFVIIFYYLVVNNFTRRRLQIWFWGLLVSAGLVVWYSLIQVILHSFFVALLPSLLGSYLNLVIFLLTFLPVFLLAFLKTPESGWGLPRKAWLFLKGFWLSVLGLELVLFFLLGSFFAPAFWFIAGLAVLAILSLFLLHFFTTSSRRLSVAFLVFLGLIVLALLGGTAGKSLDLPREASLSSRVSGEIAWEGLKNDFFLGSGPSTFYYDFTRYKSVLFNQMRAADLEIERPAGSLFNWASTLGFLGVLAWLGVIAWVLVYSFRAVITNRKKEEAWGVAGLGLGCLVLFALSLFIAWNNAIFLIFYLLLVFLGVLTEWLRRGRKSPSKIVLSRASILLPVSLAGLALVIILFLGGIKMLVADVYASGIRLDDPQKSLISQDKASSWFSLQDEYQKKLSGYCLSLLSLKASEQDREEAKKYLQQSLQSAHRAVNLAPRRASNQEALALAYENLYLYSGEGLARAEHHYKNYQFLNPQSPSPYLSLAWINLAKAQAPDQAEKKKEHLEAALEKYDQALARKQNLAGADYGKAIVWEEMGEREKAIKALKTAREKAPENPDYSYELGRLYFNQGVSEVSLNLNQSGELSLKEFLSRGNISLNSNRWKYSGDDLDSLVQESIENNLSWNSDLREAEKYFREAREINQYHLPSLYSLTLLYQYLGETGLARETVEKSLKNIENKELKEIIQEDMSQILKN